MVVGNSCSSVGLARGVRLPAVLGSTLVRGVLMVRRPNSWPHGARCASGGTWPVTCSVRASMAVEDRSGGGCGLW